MTELHAAEATEQAALNEEPPTERERVRQWLLSALLHGRVPLPTEGDPGSEEWLAQESGAESRMPARMALAVLAGEGLIEQAARRGFWVVEYDSADIGQIVAMRADLEARVVGVLAEAEGPVDPEAWEQVLQAHAAMRGTIETGAEPADFADMQAQFHVGLALAGDLRVAARYVDEWSNRMRLFQLQNGLEAFPEVAAVERHDGLLAAIYAADRDTADDLIRRDVESLVPTAYRWAQAEKVEPQAESLGLKTREDQGDRDVEGHHGGYEVAES